MNLFCFERSLNIDKEKNNRSFWNRYAWFYDFEIATGTGLIAINIAPFVYMVEAIDFAPQMIEAAKKKAVPPNVRFSVGDATALSFEPQSFDTIIISNALHIMPKPELVLENIRGVLRPVGLLIAPTFSQGHLRQSTWNLNARILKLIGFETYSKWTLEEYVEFISQQGFAVEHWQVLRAAFPLVYLEARLNSNEVDI